MIEALFNFGEGKDSSLAFEKSIAIHSTTRVDEVVSLLEKAERAARSGAWVVVMISYEAAPGFDVALQTHPPVDFPLIWIAIYSKPADLEKLKVASTDRPNQWTPQISKQDFQSAVQRIRQLIAAGDTYQVNYTFPLTSLFHGDALSLYEELFKAQGAQYCAYLDIGRYKILSLSPELFFERKGNLIKTKPMKGTIRRGRWLQEDEELSRQLEASMKDRAENVMIVDLLRNDLGKIAVHGSVEVSNLFELERYPTLWQMTSTVTATLAAETTLKQIMSALFPCGSITGAPKVRTMQIIRELEPFPRLAYTGAIGVIGPNGECTFNVAIRTLILDAQTGSATFNVGSGITYDSRADSEYEECILKSEFLTDATESISLIETILLEEGELFLLNRHLSRLKDSAAFFEFAFDEERIREEALAVARTDRFGKWKVRLLLNKSGAVNITRNEILELNYPLKLRVSTKRVISSNTLLFHKTTERSVYNEALAFSNCDDVLLFNERGEITESTIANVVFSREGQLWTPPVSSGLLPGTFRAQLLADQRIHERVLRVEELGEVDEIYLINSVRRWMPAVLLSD